MWELAEYDGPREAEICYLENAWRERVHRSVLLNLTLALHSILPLDLIRQVQKHHTPPWRVVDVHRLVPRGGGRRAGRQTYRLEVCVVHGAP